MFAVIKSNIDILYSNIGDIDSNYEQFTENKTYSLGVEVQFGEDIFRSLKDNNIDKPVALKTSLSWKYLKKANKWAAFDEQNSTKTQNNDEIIYVVDTRYVNYIALLEVESREVKFELFNLLDDIDITLPFWSKTIKGFDRKPYNYTEYITMDGVYNKTILQELYPLNKTKLKITISNPSLTAKVGNIIYGKKQDLGTTLTGVTLEIGNVLDIDIDTQTGYIKQVPIMPKRDINIPVLIDIKDIERVQEIFMNLLGQATLFVAFEGINNVRPSLAVYGFFKNIRIPIGAEKNEYEIQIKGVI